MLRRELLALARGDVLEIGVGTGINLGLYRFGASGVTSLTGERHLLLSLLVILQSADTPFLTRSGGPVCWHAGRRQAASSWAAPVRWSWEWPGGIHTG